MCRKLCMYRTAATRTSAGHACVRSQAEKVCQDVVQACEVKQLLQGWQVSRRRWVTLEGRAVRNGIPPTMQSWPCALQAPCMITNRLTI